MNKKQRDITARLAGLAAPRVSAERSKERITIRADGADSTEIQLYGPIGGWFGVNAAELSYQLRQVSSANLSVRINSPGGDVFEAIAMFNLLRNHSATVTTHNDGLAASAASYLMLAGDKVVTEPGAMWMIHDASTETYGTAADHRESADLLDKVSDNIAGFYAERMGMSVEQVRAILASGDKWYTGQEALDAGLTDELISGEATPAVEQRISQWSSLLPEALRAQFIEQAPEQPAEQEQAEQGEQGTEQGANDEATAAANTLERDRSWALAMLAALDS